MNRGYVKLWRKSKNSTVFAHDGLWKLWCLCLMKANHKEAEVTIPGLLEPIKIKPGQFVTGRDSLHFEYHQGDLKKKYSRKAAPTAITLYRWLLSLQKVQMLHIKSHSKYSIITIINWSQYQENEQQVNNKRTTDEHKQECKKNEKEETPDIFSLRERYSDQKLIDDVFAAIASTRKSNKIADSVLLSQLQKWKRYPVVQVEAGMRIYLDKGCADQGKDEKYLLGIIRNQKVEAPKQQTTGSSLLDSFYANAAN